MLLGSAISVDKATSDSFSFDSKSTSDVATKKS